MTAGDGTQPIVSGIRVLMKACLSASAAQVWTFPGSSGAYADNYTVRTNGLCLSLAPSPDTTGGLSHYRMLVLETCDGTTRQKWNAPGEIVLSRLHDTRELVGG